ncbi:hypothetical protein JOM56_014853 [Amanita muscaria]
MACARRNSLGVTPDVEDWNGVRTRTRNKEVRPGECVKPAPKAPAGAAKARKEAEKAHKEREQAAKAHKEAEAIQAIAAIEQDATVDYSVEKTPRPPNGPQRLGRRAKKPLPQAQLLVGTDLSEPSGEEFVPGSEQGSTTQGDTELTDEVGTDIKGTVKKKKGPAKKKDIRAQVNRLKDNAASSKAMNVNSKATAQSYPTQKRVYERVESSENERLSKRKKALATPQMDSWSAEVTTTPVEGPDSYSEALEARESEAENPESSRQVVGKYKDHGGKGMRRQHIVAPSNSMDVDSPELTTAHDQGWADSWEQEPLRESDDGAYDHVPNQSSNGYSNGWEAKRQADSQRDVNSYSGPENDYDWYAEQTMTAVQVETTAAPMDDIIDQEEVAGGSAVPEDHVHAARVSDTACPKKPNPKATIQHWASSIPAQAKPKGKSISSLPTLTSSGTSRNSRSSQITSTARSAIQANVKVRVATPVEDPTVEQVGGLSDCDEMAGPERIYAHESPPKGKRRLDSSDLTKAAAQRDPWGLGGDDAIITALQQIANAFLENGETYVDQLVYTTALQRLSDAWRNPTASVALSVVHAFFEGQDEYRESNLARQEFATEQLKTLSFLFPDDEESQESLAFTGPLVLGTFTRYLSAVDGATDDIAGLDFPDRDQMPRGALVLAATAVERAFSFWSKGLLTIEAMRAARPGCAPKLSSQQVNNANMTETTRTPAFSAVLWKAITDNYMRSAQSLDKDDMKYIFMRTKTFGKLTGAIGGSDSTGTSQAVPDDPRCRLVRPRGQRLDKKERAFDDNSGRAPSSVQSRSVTPALHQITPAPRPVAPASHQAVATSHQPAPRPVSRQAVATSHQPAQITPTPRPVAPVATSHRPAPRPVSRQAVATSYQPAPNPVPHQAVATSHQAPYQAPRPRPVSSSRKGTAHVAPEPSCQSADFLPRGFCSSKSRIL